MKKPLFKKLWEWTHPGQARAEFAREQFGALEKRKKNLKKFRDYMRYES